SEKTSLISLGWTSRVTENSLLAWALTRSASSQTPLQCNFPTVSAWQWALDAIPQGGSVVRLHRSVQRPKKFLVRTGTPDLRSCFAAVRGSPFSRRDHHGTQVRPFATGACASRTVGSNAGVRTVPVS